MVRVAVIQLESTRDALALLDSCSQLIDRAATEHAARIVVFPELPLEEDDELSSTGKLPTMLLERSARYQIWLLGSAQHRGLTTSLCVGPGGELFVRASSDLEQTGSGAFVAEDAVFSTAHGKIGLCAGPEGLHFKVTRGLSMAGADLVCVSLALRSDAELSLRIPARAVENQLFLAVAAHAPLAVEPYPLHLATLPPQAERADEQAEHASVSQIYAPLGQRLAHGQLAVADLDLPAADAEPPSDAAPKLARRPDLYRGFSVRGAAHEPSSTLAELDVAALAYSELGKVSDAVAWAREHIEDLAAKEVGLVVLPELFCFDPNLTDLTAVAAADFLMVVQALAHACRRTATHVVTSLIEQIEDSFFHVGVVIGQRGIVLRQPQLHITEAYAWAQPGRRLQTAHMPWGTLGLVVGADALVPELLEGLGRAGVELLAAPLRVQGARASTLTLSAAADEAGYAVIGATRPDSWSESTAGLASFVVDPSRWPVQRAEPDQELLRARIRLQSIRDARLPLRTPRLSLPRLSLPRPSLAALSSSED